MSMNQLRKLPKAPRPVTRSTLKRTDTVFSTQSPAGGITPNREQNQPVTEREQVEPTMNNPTFTFQAPAEVVMPVNNASEDAEPRTNGIDGAGEVTAATVVSPNPNPNTNPNPDLIGWTTKFQALLSLATALWQGLFTDITL